MTTGGWDVAALDRVREVQQLAYRCAVEVAATLEVGITEKATVRRMRTWLVDHGADDFFHLPTPGSASEPPVRNFDTKLAFFPTNRRLESNAPYVLDCAPIVGGYMADIGYAGCLGADEQFDQALADLAGYRAMILDLVRERRPLREIYQRVDERLSEQGYDNRHAVYPGHVIGHQVWRQRNHIPRVYLARFGVRSRPASVASSSSNARRAARRSGRPGELRSTRRPKASGR